MRKQYGIDLKKVRKKPGSHGNIWDLDATVVFYCMKLDAETYTVEYMGTFQKPTGTSLADQP